MDINDDSLPPAHRAALRAAMPALEGIIHAAMQEQFDSMDERLMAVASTSFVSALEGLGASPPKAEASPMPFDYSREAQGVMDRLSGVVSGIDSLILEHSDSPLAVPLAAIRNPVAIFVEDFQTRLRESTLRRLADTYTERVAVQILDNAPMSREHAFDLGYRISQASPGWMEMWAYTESDKTLECRCHKCLVGVILKKKVTAEQALAFMEAREGGTAKLLVDFAVWATGFIRDNMDASSVAHVGGTVDPDRAGTEAASFLSRLTGGQQGGK